MRSPGPASVSIAASASLLAGAALAALFAGSPTSSSAAGATPPQALRPPRAPATFTLVAGGDVALAGEPNKAMFAGIHRFLKPAELAFANLDGTLATGGSSRCVADAKAGGFVFR